MNAQRKQVEIFLKEKAVLVETLFKQKIPQGIIVRENPRVITHYHSYGGISKFFQGLVEGNLYGTICPKCVVSPDAEIRLPPRADCPDCWKRMEWFNINTSCAEVYTYSITHYPGAGFKASVPCPLISVKIPGVWTYIRVNGLRLNYFSLRNSEHRISSSRFLLKMYGYGIV